MMQSNNGEGLNSAQVNTLFVTVSDISGRTGSSVATKEMAAAFAKNDSYSTSIVCPRPDSTLPEKITENVENIYYLPIQKYGSIPTHALTQLHMIPTLLSGIQREEPDVIVARQAGSLIVPPLVAEIIDIPYVLLARGISHENHTLSPVLNRVFRLNCRLASEVYAAYSDVKKRADAARTSSQSETKIFTNAVDPDVFNPVEKGKARDALDVDLDTADLVLGYVGSMMEYHALEELILALDHVEIDVELLLVGEGPQSEYLRELVNREGVEDSVTFVGQVAHDIVDRYISSCDIMYGAVDPDFSGNAIKCYEYLACERPVITDERVEFQFIGENDFGILLTEVTPQRIGQAITGLHSCEGRKIREMGKLAREYILKNHTWQRLPELVLDDLERYKNRQQC